MCDQKRIPSAVATDILIYVVLPKVSQNFEFRMLQYWYALTPLQKLQVRMIRIKLSTEFIDFMTVFELALNRVQRAAPMVGQVDTSGLKSSFFSKLVLKSSIFFDFSPDVSTIQPSYCYQDMTLQISNMVCSSCQMTTQYMIFLVEHD